MSPFFIFGCPRSGTSLLSRMLDSHPELSVPFESHIFKMFWDQQRYYGDLSDRDNQISLIRDVLDTSILSYWSPKPEYANVLINLKHPGFAGVVDALMSSYSPNTNKLWGEKTPGHIFTGPPSSNVFQMQSLFIWCGMVVMLPRSLMTARFGPVTLDIAAKNWVKYIKAFEVIEENTNTDNFLQVKYEDLIDDPERILSEICGLLTVEYSSEMLSFYKKDMDYPTDSTNMDNLRSPLMKDNSLKWKTQLSIAEIQKLEGIAGTTLQKLGYERSDLGPVETIRANNKTPVLPALGVIQSQRYSGTTGIHKFKYDSDEKKSTIFSAPRAIARR